MRTPIKSWEAVLFFGTILLCLYILSGLDAAQRAGIQGQQFINLGLDLRGGVDLTYEAIPPPGKTEISQEMMDGTLGIIRKRIDPEGVKEIMLQGTGETGARGGKRITIQVPGEDDPERIKELVGQTALLRFIDTSDITPNLPRGAIINIEGEEPRSAPEGSDVEVVTLPASRIVVEGSQLTQAMATRDPEGGGFQVNINFNAAGGKAFGDFTSRHVGQPFSIVLDGEVISSPNIQSAIRGGSGRITGLGGGPDDPAGQQEAQNLSTLLNSGALPVTLNELASMTVGPTLGERAISTSYTSFIIGIGLVAIFLMIIYRLLGVMANLALILYTLLFLGLMGAFEATLTLPGIAGFILSIGMAVDANILIFERMKEEFNDGKAFGHALQLGFERAFPAILDGHLASIITGILLYSLGTGAIKGYAVTLILGNILSMYTAIFLTRLWITLLLQGRGLHKPALICYGVKVVNG